MKKRTWLVFLLFSILNCSINMGSFQEIRISTPKDKEEISSARIKGEHCKFTSFFGFPQLDLAVQDAISKVPGAKGLKDVKISDYRVSFVNYFCILVEGIPAK
jgi:hypothetical protein